MTSSNEHNMFADTLRGGLDYIKHLNIDEASRSKLERLTRTTMQMHDSAARTADWNETKANGLLDEAIELIHDYQTPDESHHAVIQAHISVVGNSLMRQAERVRGAKI